MAAALGRRLGVGVVGTTGLVALIFASGGGGNGSPQAPSSLQSGATSTAARQKLHSHATSKFEVLSPDQVYARFHCRSLAKDAQPAIGQGAYSHVIAALDDATKRNVALKIVSKVFTDAADFTREVEALRVCRMHPNIVALHEVIEVPEVAAWILVEELLEGGEVFDRLIAHGPFTERAAARVVSSVASAIGHMHALGWAHNDVKPENLVFAQKGGGKDEFDHVKLIDFGFATKLDGSSPPVRRDIGTEAYWAPEMFAEDGQSSQRTREFVISPGLDLWGLGLLAYILLFGCHPFDRLGDATTGQIQSRAKLGSLAEGYLQFTHAMDPTFTVSEEAKDFITRLLHPDPNRRPPISQVLEHPWLTSKPDDLAQHAASHQSAGGSLRQLYQTRQRRRIIHGVLDTVLSDHAIARLPDGKVDENVDLLGMLADGLKSEVAEAPAILASCLRELHKGEVVYRIGDSADGVYVVIRGKVQLRYESALNESKTVHTMERVSVFGEQALIDGRRTRNAQAVAQVDGTTVLFFPTSDVVAVFGGSPHLTELVLDNATRRLRRTAGALLCDLGVPAPEVFRKGHVFFSQGEPADSLYIVKRGEVISTTTSSSATSSRSPRSKHDDDMLSLLLEGNQDRRSVLGVWKAGDVFGVSAVTGTERMATAVASSDCLVVRVPRETLMIVVDKEPNLRENLVRQLRRLKERWNAIEG